MRFLNQPEVPQGSHPRFLSGAARDRPPTLTDCLDLLSLPPSISEVCVRLFNRGTKRVWPVRVTRCAYQLIDARMIITV